MKFRWLLLLLMLLISTTCFAQTNSVLLTWTATGNDTTSGTANKCTVFWSSTVPDTTGYSTWFNAGGKVPTTPTPYATWITSCKNTPGPAPLLAGTVSSFTLFDSFLVNTKYYFVLTVCDAAGNCIHSNLSSLVIPLKPDVIYPNAITDLKVK